MKSNERRRQVVTALAVEGTVIGAMAFGASQFGNGGKVTTASVQDAADSRRISEDNSVESKRVADELARLVNFVMQTSFVHRS